jgi:hypothetical protein
MKEYLYVTFMRGCIIRIENETRGESYPTCYE